MNTDNSQPFWSVNQDGKTSLNNFRFKMFLENNSYFKNKPNENSSFNLIHKTGIFLQIRDEVDIKDFVLNYIQNDVVDESVFNLVSGKTSIFKRDFLSMIKSEKIETLKDTKDTAYLFYENGVVEVTKEKKELKPYKHFGLHVWKDQVIKRKYAESADHHSSEFRTFIWKVSGESVERYNTFQSIIGYLLHSYNTNATAKAIVLNDEMISDEPNGRSGKSLIWNAIKHLKKVNDLNGKNFSFQGDFPYQAVSTDCQVLVFDDVKKGFTFENLFSVVTEGIDITYKGKDTIKLPIEDSPKILITTNYILKGSGGSHDARKFEVELSTFFNSGYTPIDFFGHYLFTDWDDSEWARFDSYMIECLRKYLSKGLVQYKSISLPFKKLEVEITKELMEAIKSIDKNEWIEANSFYETYLSTVSKKWVALSKNKVTISLKKYCEFYGFEYEQLQSNGVKKFKIVEHPTIVNPNQKDIWDQIHDENGIN